MPHQKKRKMPQVNGDVPHYAVIEHVLGYPLVNDALATYKNNALGKKSIELGDSAYRTFAQPLLPYLSRPFQYIEPYVKKADDLGDKTLSKVDEKFPIVKKPTDELVSDAKTIAFFPIRIGQIGKDHVVSTYQTEFKKTGGGNLVAYAKAALTTTLTIGTDAYTNISNFLGSKKEDAKQAADRATN
ncbi:hypothetical protein B0H63DRAFT_159256 [Podospora didyma]|uniref:Uncharacterized protein n=1 Tax=Podospora didyma TaxID=330526 RepID=A0AAE0NTV6_9PEZI|nr:hypothetical protein B0H63DRAFT_159256 [Podospora didyma]